LVASEVNSFTENLSSEDNVNVSRFSFTVPEAMRQSYEDIIKEEAILRRSRSHPVGLGDSDEEDIEVPRFSSLDYQDVEDCQVDSDGDLDPPRSGSGGRRSEMEMRIEHRTRSSLGEVGLQVWRGSLLLADYILHHHQQFRDKDVLEVGSGSGLASIIASFCGAK